MKDYENRTRKKWKIVKYCYDDEEIYQLKENALKKNTYHL